VRKKSRGPCLVAGASSYAGAAKGQFRPRGQKKSRPDAPVRRGGDGFDRGDSRTLRAARRGSIRCRPT